MKRVYLCLKCIWAAFSRIHLVDKCLILFMVVLLSQSAYSMFCSNFGSSETNSIDIIVRTSTAAIFGYFLSANFIRHASSQESRQEILPTLDKGSTGGKERDSKIRNQIGFSNTDQKPDLEKLEAEKVFMEEKVSKNMEAGRLQIMVATFIGLFCLISLIILRNTFHVEGEVSAMNSIAATVAQFRDFVSGCVGFLIGCPTNGDSDSPK